VDHGYHESDLSEPTRDLHRALRSVMEELEAIDWYQQRIDVAGDADLREILVHNRDEEMEHAAMGIAWLQRKIPEFAAQLRRHVSSAGEPAGGGSGADAEPPAGPGDHGGLLKRRLAPIAPAGWKEIDEVARERLHGNLSVRRRVPFDGPHGPALASHSPEEVHLFLGESFAFQVLEPRAAVELRV
jgi:hypothetical protein